MIVDFEKFVDAIKTGEVVCLPTDTVYGFGVNPFEKGNLKKLFKVKNRPSDLAVVLFVSEISELDIFTKNISERVAKVLNRFWPGPFTAVLEMNSSVGVEFGSKDGSIGLRCPDLDVILKLLKVTGPLAVTSANIHGSPPLTSAREVEVYFPGIPTLDGGTRVSKPSSVVDLRSERPILLREGLIGISDVLSIWNE